MKILLLLLSFLAAYALGANPPYGQLGISGKYLIQASNNQQVQLRGMSLWWSQWMPQFYNTDTVNALKNSWNANVVRAAMGVEMGGYLDNPNAEIQKVYAVVDAAIAAGIYVVVDWHDNNAQYHQSQAIQFFANISQKYNGNPHIIYEIFNQPQAVSWSSIKPYHLAVIAAIRANDPNNVIVVGTPNWSQYVDEASNDPITGQTNIAYSLQFAAGTHGQWNRDKVQYALNKNLPIFVTQYMTVNTDGYGSVNQGEMNAWWNLLDQNKISHLNWAIEDKDEPTAAFWPGTNAQQVGDDSRLTPSGQFVKNKLKSYPAGTSAPPSGSSSAPSSVTTTKAAITTKAATTTTKAVTVTPPTGTPATPYGRLAIQGKYLVSASTGLPVQLHGMSLFWSQWMAQYYNQATVTALKCSWNTNVVRAAMGVESGGYLDNKQAELQKVYAVIDAAISAGIYVVVDWHDHNAQYHQSQAIEFFANISQKYGNYPNIIYETYNEPLQVSWSSVLKPYHQAVIAAIRANDPNNVIVVGTPNWSQYVDEASNDPITNYNNIAYTLHYYSGTHKHDLRNRATTAINNNIALFVTEYGTVNADGNGAVDQNESNLWWNFLDQNKISYINWSVADKDEGASALKPGTTASQVGDSSKWTNSGTFVRNKYVSQSNGVSC